MKKFLALVTSLAMVLAVLTGCGSTSDESTGGDAAGEGGDTAAETYKVGLVILSGDHGFTGESVRHAELEAEALMEEHDDLEIVVKSCAEASAQITEIENLIAEGDIDAIMLWPTEGEALRSAAQTIVDAGIKLVVYDRLIEDFEGLEGQMMGDNFSIGEEMGEYLNTYFADDDQVNYLRFVGDSSTVTSQRSGGMDEVIDANKFNQINETFVTDWSTETAQEQMENWLNAHSDEEIESLDLIVTHDDEIVDGVTIALQNYYNNNPDSGLNVKLITGVGARRETLATYDETVANGIELVTYFFSPSFARNAIRLGIAAAAGEQYDGQDITGQLFLIPSQQVDKSNVEEFRASDEFAERYSVTLD